MSQESEAEKRFVLVQGDRELLFSNLDELSRHISRQKSREPSCPRTKTERHRSVKPTRSTDTAVLPSWRLSETPHHQKSLGSILDAGKQACDGLSVRHRMQAQRVDDYTDNWENVARNFKQKIISKALDKKSKRASLATSMVDRASIATRTDAHEKKTEMLGSMIGSMPAEKRRFDYVVNNIESKYNNNADLPQFVKPKNDEEKLVKLENDLDYLTGEVNVDKFSGKS